MKKYLLVVLTVMGLGVGFAKAETDGGLPQGPVQAVFNADYYGVDYSTAQFTTAFTTVGVGEFSVYGVTFSSGSPTDFVQLYDTGTWLPGSQGGVSTETIRIYNITASTTASAATDNLAPYAVGYVPVGPRPIRFKKGLGWRVSTNSYNSVILHFYRRKTKVNGDK